MRILIYGFLAFLLLAIPCRYWYVCQIKQHCAKQEIVSGADRIETKGAAQNIVLNSNDGKVLEVSGSIKINPGAISPEGDYGTFLDDVAAYLADHPNQQLTITGRWLDEEAGVDSKPYENMGLARAASMRDSLTVRGVDLSRLEIAHARVADDPEEGILFFTQEKEEITFTNVNFSGDNFDSGSAAFSPDVDFVQYVDTLIIYLEANPDKQLALAGHTDNKGSEDLNRKLGLQRAESVKRYLVGRGVRAAISTRSAGATEPVADNDTEEGRAKNRRFNLKIN